MPTYVVNQFYFGTFADLDPIEASSASGQLNNDVNENTQVPGWQAGKVFNVNNMQLVSVTQNDVVREGNTTRLEENDFKNRAASQGGPMGADSFTYTIGGTTVTSDIDSTFSWNVQITRGNGTTFQQVLTFVQLENGAIFSNFVPSSFVNQSIQSVRLMSHDSSKYFGATANRNLSGTRIVCFADDAMIATHDGEVAAGKLKLGDLVITQDNGAQPVRWLSKRALCRDELQAMPKLLPICIQAGALGQGIPRRVLRVSPQHRILIRSRIANRLYSSEGVLVAAKHLLDMPEIEVQPVDSITYVHFACAQHEIVFAEGAPVESFYPGRMAIAALDDEARRELFAIFPELAAEQDVQSVRVTLSGKEGRTLVRRHQRNHVALLSTR